MKSFIVIGMGRFGTTLAKELCDMGCEVLAVDNDTSRINAVMDVVTHAVQADTTDERAIKQLGVRNFDAVIISVGDDIRTSILTTVLCKEQGAKYIISKASDELYTKLLLKTGADRVVQPEREGGMRLAHSLVNDSIVDYLDLSDEYSIAEARLPLHWVGKSLKQIDVRRNYGVSVIAIRRDSEIIVTIDPDSPMRDGDRLVMIGANAQLEKIH